MRLSLSKNDEITGEQVRERNARDLSNRLAEGPEADRRSDKHPASFGWGGAGKTEGGATMLNQDSTGGTVSAILSERDDSGPGKNPTVIELLSYALQSLVGEEHEEITFSGSETVRDILKVALEGTGYEGLRGEECACPIEDLMPCNSCDINLCKAGYKGRGYNPEIGELDDCVGLKKL